MGTYVTFSIKTHQIWSCHVILASHLENFYFRLFLYEILGKVTKFGLNWLKNKKVTGKKQISGSKTPPPPVLIRSKKELRLNVMDYLL